MVSYPIQKYIKKGRKEMYFSSNIGYIKIFRTAQGTPGGPNSQ